MNQKTKSNSKRPYSQPKLIEHGTVHKMTLGATSPIGSNGQCPPGTTFSPEGVCVNG